MQFENFRCDTYKYQLHVIYKNYTLAFCVTIFEHSRYRHFVHVARNTTRNCVHYALPTENICGNWLRSSYPHFYVHRWRVGMSNIVIS